MTELEQIDAVARVLLAECLADMTTWDVLEGEVAESWYPTPQTPMDALMGVDSE